MSTPADQGLEAARREGTLRQKLNATAAEHLTDAVMAVLDESYDGDELRDRLRQELAVQLEGVL